MLTFGPGPAGHVLADHDNARVVAHLLDQCLVQRLAGSISAASQRSFFQPIADQSTFESLQMIDAIRHITATL